MNYKNVELGEICDFVRGVSFDGNEVLDIKADGYVPILRAGNIQDELLYIHDDLVWVPEKRVAKEQYFQVGDIAICMASGSPAVLGKTAQLNQAFTGSVGAFCGIIRPKKVDLIYMAYWFKSESFLRWRDDQANGVNIQNLRPSEIKDIQIPLPPLPEQHRIANLLTRADRLRRLRRLGDTLSASLLQSVFLEMFGDLARNEMGWNKVELTELIRPVDKINYGVVQPGDDFPNGKPIIRVGDFDDIPHNTKNLKLIDPAVEASYRRSRIVGDEILIACVGSIGKIALVNEKLKGFNIVRAVARVPANYALINRLFLATYLSMPFVQDYFQRETRTVSQPTLNITQIEETPILLPPLPQQEQFAAVVRRVESLPVPPVLTVLVRAF